MSNDVKKRLDNPPYLQLAIDIPDLPTVQELLSSLSETSSQRLLLEIGTPLIKNEGLKNAVPVFRHYFPKSYLIADLKTLDVGKLEVSLGAKTGVDACVVSGLAPLPTIKGFIEECQKLALDTWIDTLGTNLETFKPKLLLLDSLPDVIIVHRGIDEEIAGKESVYESISEIKSNLEKLVAIAGGLNLKNVHLAKDHGADIFIIGRAIYQSKNPQKSLDQFLSIIL